MTIVIKTKDSLEEVIEKFRFESMKEKYPNSCVCYKQNNPCHNMKNLNCLFCFCPEYDISREEGGCLRNSKKGKWAYSEKYKTGKIWDCSNCTYPHKKNIIKKYLRQLFFE